METLGRWVEPSVDTLGLGIQQVGYFLSKTHNYTFQVLHFFDI